MQPDFRAAIASIVGSFARSADDRVVDDAKYLHDLFQRGVIAPSRNCPEHQRAEITSEMAGLGDMLSEVVCRGILDAALALIADIRQGLTFGALEIRSADAEQLRIDLDRYWHLAEYRAATAPALTPGGRASRAFFPPIREFPSPEPSLEDRRRWVKWTEGRDWFPPLHEWLEDHPAGSDDEHHATAALDSAPASSPGLLRR